MNYYEALGRKTELLLAQKKHSSVLSTLAQEASHQALNLKYSTAQYPPRAERLITLRALIDQIERLDGELISIDVQLGDLPLPPEAP